MGVVSRILRQLQIHISVSVFVIIVVSLKPYRSSHLGQDSLVQRMSNKIKVIIRQRIKNQLDEGYTKNNSKNLASGKFI